MSRLLTAILLSVPAAAWSQQVEPPRPAAAPAQPPKYNPNDPKSVLDYINKEIDVVLHDRDALRSVLRLGELEALFAGLPQDAPELRDGIAQARIGILNMRDKVYIHSITLEALLQKVRDDPDNFREVYCLGQKIFAEVYQPAFIVEPDECAKKVTAVREVLAKVEQAAISDLTRKQLTRSLRTVDDLDKDIALSLETRKKQQALIGQDAAQFKVETWLNGSELAADDLKGKVLLLDLFHAANFIPDDSDYQEWLGHLQRLAEWQKKYAERGLFVIGLTGDNNVRWDEAKQAPVRVRAVKERVPQAEQLALLKRLIEKHELKHRVAIQQREEHFKTIMYYPSLTQPHVIVVDRQGKIRLIRGGVSEKFTRDIDQALASLLGE
ncbi:MAG TPA: hypothetical protein VFB80_17950 [Pirellulaceae bacterium]|nr:hypothetical protein [Pirellulaceae bacterium]